MIQSMETMNRALFVALPLLYAAVWHWSAGRSQRRGSTFFGARVAAGFADSDTGRAIARAFHWRLWSSAFALAAAAALSRSIAIAAIGEVVAGSVAFALAHRRTRRQASAPPPAERVASLMTEPESPWLTALDWLAMIVPVAAPIAILIFLTHYGSGFSQPFLSRHCFSAVLALSLGLMCSANQFALRYCSRPSDWASDPGASHRYRTCVGVMFAAIFTFITLQMCAMMLIDFRPAVPWLQHWNMSGYFAIAFPAQALWLLGVWRLRWWLSRHIATGSVDPMPDTCWTWGIFYFNRQDPAVVVPVRSGVGAAYNYARPSVWVVTVVIFALLIASAVRNFEW